MVTWALFSTDILGSKLDPKPIHDSSLETKIELLLEVDGKDIKLCRSQKKTASYHIDGVPEKATAYNELVESLFDKDLFLSLFNPTYFFTQKWQEQRQQVLQYVDEPLNAEVYAEMLPIHKEALEGPLKKHSLEDLEKIHRERFKTQDKALERAGERVLTLEEQLSSANTDELDKNAIQKQIENLIKERDALDDKRFEQQRTNQSRLRIESKVESIKSQITRQRNLVDSIKNESIDEHCATCGQALDEESIQNVKDSLNSRFSKEVQAGKQLVAEYNELNEQLKELPELLEVDSSAITKELDAKIYPLRSQLEQASRLVKLKEDIEAAKANRDIIREERAESQRIIEAIKVFRGKQAELMVKKVGDLFTTISVRLFEELKNGDFRDTFEIEMDNKPYSKLSTAEKIKCGLEMIEVLSQQSGVITPTFVDNAESILKYTAPAGQLITAKVKAGEFKIETENPNKEVA
ncbi:hypothetical protein ACN6MY_03575 [Peribacillus sp. B-H-3]|uniref:hypothetical protein n=1 Tax=Peribacillus sp. B-H-3 TaxID=3400420 RepID=UPI003B01083E